MAGAREASPPACQTSNCRAPPGLDDDGLGIAGFGDGGVERPPEFLARIFVERHDLGVGPSGGDEDHPLAVNQGRGAETPDWQLGLEVVPVALTPEQFAIRGVQDPQIARRAENVDTIAVHGRRRAGAERMLHARIVGFPCMHPEETSGALVKTDGALDAAGALAGLKVGDEDAPAGDRGAGVAGVNGHAPDRLELRAGEIFSTMPVSFQTPVLPRPRHSGQSSANNGGVVKQRTSASVHPVKERGPAGGILWRRFTGYDPRRS